MGIGTMLRGTSVVVYRRSPQGTEQRLRKVYEEKYVAATLAIPLAMLNNVSYQNITSLAATSNKIYALSSSGDIYAVASARALQKSRPTAQDGNGASEKSSWWDTLGLGKIGGVFRQDPGVDCVKLGVNGDGLKKGERYVGSTRRFLFDSHS
jgi:hypothetical protein